MFQNGPYPTIVPKERRCTRDICSVKELIFRYRPELAGALTGAAGGWIYWYFAGCASGACAVTSDPAGSSLYGMLLGAAAAGIFSSGTKEKEKQKQETNENKSK